MPGALCINDGRVFRERRADKQATDIYVTRNLTLQFPVERETP